MTIVRNSLPWVRYFSILLAACVSSVALAKRPVIASRFASQSSQSNHCGLYAVKAAGAAIDCEIPLTSLFSTDEYLSSRWGSTATDLLRAATDAGMTGEIVSGYTASDLLAASGPVLLRFENDAQPQSGHWVALVGTDDDRLMLFDSLIGYHLSTTSEVDLMWDGNAVVLGENAAMVSETIHQMNIRFLVAHAFWMCIPIILLGLAFQLSDHFITQRDSRLIPFLIVFAVLYGVHSWRTDDGAVDRMFSLRSCLAATPNAGDSASGGESYIREIPDDPLKVLVDCRLPDAFRLGTIPGSVNLPVNASFGQWHLFLKSLPEDARIVLYCQSAGCEWAAITQRRLDCLGLSSEVYSGGYARYGIEHSGELDD
ncbi:rhodanese-like domain-containing protein [Rhodopirellula europaea]|uniref:rhodanese-like domain-containing protein n=1 Tax=Rhodopirellula europaea TaxID=1263866 RepID=UPI003D2986E8